MNSYKCAFSFVCTIFVKICESFTKLDNTKNKNIFSVKRRGFRQNAQIKSGQKNVQNRSKVRGRNFIIIFFE